ncbi:hypothetical protein [Ahrensia sp. 13_GOM-1096m]|uniref:hypothetical protein n=1 Tax=Ahrensia sp. 13_GOM-1096m TaxID=1380380 RepID=UPI000479D7C8|nr:hypothetical protein [Ahrensia sp. 13_GOM-1096m]
MRRFVATLLVLVLTMVSLPLQTVGVNASAENHLMESVSHDGAENKLADCCEMPMNSMHHGSVHCSMDYQTLVYYSNISFGSDTVQFSPSGSDQRVVETTSSHFRPPIFN